MKIKKKKIRKKELKEDAFSKFIKRVLYVWGEKKKVFLYIFSAVILIAIILIFYLNFRVSTNRNADEKFIISITLYMQNRIKDAYQNFELIQSEYYGTEAARKALFFMANIDYRIGEIDKAMEEFRKVSRISKDEYILASSIEGIAQCFEQKGEVDSAIFYYELASKKYKSTGFKSECLLNLGRVYEGSGRFGEAEEVYRKILSMVETPNIKEEAQNRLNMLSGLRQVIGK